ncbi:MAG: phosphopantetheine-binding protein [Solirubrobacterales bacterium]
MPTEVTTDRVEQVIFDGLAEVGAEREQISCQASFEDLDVDSLDLVEVSQIVEDEFGVELEGDDLKDLNTVGEVIDLVVARSS